MGAFSRRPKPYRRFALTKPRPSPQINPDERLFAAASGQRLRANGRGLSPSHGCLYHFISAARAADGPRKGFNPPAGEHRNFNLLFLAHTADSGRTRKKERKVSMSAAPLPLPENPNLDWLRKQAKRRLEELCKSNPGAQLAEAQFDLAQQYGFPSWRALKAHIDSLTLDGRFIQAARKGDVATLTSLLDQHPEKLRLCTPPYGGTLLHVAAQHGQLAAVDLLLNRGFDVNAREKGDNTYAMHWAAAAGHLDVVRRLADAGGDVVGHGDDHELEVIGWATCWDGGDDAPHRAVADLLVRRGARHHIFSAIALNLTDEVRRIVAADPSALNRRQSRNENHRTPLHFAVLMKRLEMISLLLELGADPLAADGSGQPVAIHATAPDTDRPV